MATLLIGVSAATLVVPSLWLWSVLETRRVLREEATYTAQLLTVTVADTVSRSIAAVDVALLSAQEAWADKSDISRRQLLRERADMQPLIRDIVVYDRNGEVRLAARATAVPGLPDSVLEAVADGPRFAATWHPGPEIGTILIARRMNDVYGAADGAIVALVDVGQILRQMPMGPVLPALRLGLCATDAPVSPDVPVSSDLGRAPREERQSLGGEAPGPVAGGVDCAAVAHVAPVAAGGGTLVVGVGVDETGLLAGWRRDMLRSGLVAGSATLIIFALLILLWRQFAAVLQAQSEADAANATKSAFLANVSHELRTPLNAILGFSDVMRGGLFGKLDNPRYEEYVRDIHTSGMHLHGLINDLLDVAKLESGTFQLDRQPVDLAEELRNAIRLVSPLAGACGVRVILEPLADLPSVRGEPLRLRQAFLNLLTNAIKFTPAGGTVTVQATAEPLGWITVAIVDSGVGIPTEDLERVFEPFSQADNRVAGRRRDGVGLGLPLTRRLIEAHDGRVVLSSSVGQGTRAEIVLPVDAATDGGPEAPA